MFAFLLTMYNDIGLDITLIVDAARRVLAGQAMYTDPTAAQFGPTYPHYYGPPALAALYAPLAPLPDFLIVRVAFWAAFALAGFGVWALLRSSDRPQPRRYLAAILTGIALCYVVLGGAMLGNPSMLILPLLALAFVGFERRSDWLVAFGIGTAMALRLYPVAMLIPLLIAGRYRAAAASIGVALVWVLIGILFAGLPVTLDYIDVAIAINSVADPHTISTNGSLTAVAWRLGASESVVQVVRIASIAGGLALLVIGGLWLRRQDHSDRLIGFGLAVAGNLLLLGTTWDHYYVPLLIIVVGVVLATRQPIFGLAAMGLISAQLGGGLAMVWLPILGIAAVLLASRRRPAVAADPRLLLDRSPPTVS